MNSDESQNGRTGTLVRSVIGITAIGGIVLAFRLSGIVAILVLLLCLWGLMVVSRSHTPVEAGCVIVLIVVLTSIGLGIIHLFRA